MRLSESSLSRGCSWRFRLGSNLDQLVLLVKNWPDDPHEGCDVKSLADFGNGEVDLVDQLEEEFEKEMENLVEACEEPKDIDN